MNHNAVEIYKQAITFAYGTVEKEHWDTSVFQGVIAGKFAELIVRECCNVLQGEDIRYGGYGYNQGFLHKKIKEHFGVEE